MGGYSNVKETSWGVLKMTDLVYPSFVREGNKTDPDRPSMLALAVMAMG